MDLFNGKLAKQSWYKLPVNTFVSNSQDSYFTNADACKLYTKTFFTEILNCRFAQYMHLKSYPKPQNVYTLDYETLSDQGHDLYKHLELLYQNPKPDFTICEMGNSVETITHAKVQDKIIFRWYGGQEWDLPAMYTYFE
tara:strand:+ start:25 stop:441 length:417 start_codon:yes stop_codon:yes gene_type:complete